MVHSRGPPILRQKVKSSEEIVRDFQFTTDVAFEYKAAQKVNEKKLEELFQSDNTLQKFEKNLPTADRQREKSSKRSPRDSIINNIRSRRKFLIEQVAEIINFKRYTTAKDSRVKKCYEMPKGILDFKESLDVVEGSLNLRIALFKNSPYGTIAEIPNGMIPCYVEGCEESFSVNGDFEEHVDKHLALGLSIKENGDIMKMQCPACKFNAKVRVEDIKVHARHLKDIPALKLTIRNHYRDSHHVRFRCEDCGKGLTYYESQNVCRASKKKHSCTQLDYDLPHILVFKEDKY
ncbi:hypothetical protein DdX_16046 [Ditylenchus destructor]|uniref:C2H2-type domain-containing protein n=1 Tax=Ditylenchus destructor TaxID=166010 RepID=A0AAD4MPP6_9BILA|nr:hypothetical protein DdX_16046 [Ditylenchus destructor]